LKIWKFDVAGTILTVLGSLAGIFLLVMIITIADGPFADWK